MPIGTMTMILANVGMQIYNNWCSSRQNSKLQQKREEFEQAARERNKERMWKLMREGQELTLQLEQEKHQQRLDELKNDIGNLLQRMAYTATINYWPLNVLPIVMKNQALGNLLVNQEESVAVHCIFTPSNSNEFNKRVFPLIENSLEAYCNQHWSIMGDHPVLFYSGAWKTGTAPTDVQIDSMRTALSNLPTVLITPFFRPNDGKLIFQLRMWGVGTSSRDNADFDDLYEFEPTEFQRTYTDKDDYVNEAGLLDEIIEDVVPYLECLIGCMADTYFWSAFGLSPCLPRLLTSGVINTDGMKYLVNDSREYYGKLLIESSHGDIVFSHENELASLLEGSIKLWDKENVRKAVFEHIFLAMCSSNVNKKIYSWDDLYTLTRSDNPKDTDFYGYVILRNLTFIRKCGSRINVKSQNIEKMYNSLSKISREQFEIIDTDTFDIEQLFRLVRNRKEQAINPKYFIFIAWNPNIIIGTFSSEEYKSCVFSKGHTARFFIIRHIDYSIIYTDGPKEFENKWDRSYYGINLINNELIKMKEKRFEEQFGRSFERIGKGLGKIFDGITSPNKDSATDTLCGEGITSQQTDSTEQILSYFIANAGKTIPTERVENMSLQNVLDWVDNNVPPFADKVYLIKGVNAKYQKYVFCVFFGSGDKVMLQEGFPSICFITSQYNEEMKQTFKENDICIIPLK